MPVPHDEEFDNRLFAKPGVKAVYDALEDEYAALDALLHARSESGLSQFVQKPG